MSPWPKRNWPKSCIGTGDIEPPKPRPTEIIAPRWYMIQKGIDDASEKDREWLVEQLSQGLLRTKGQIKAAVARLGCSDRDIEALRWTPAIVARVRDMIQARAVYYTGEALPYQAELAKTEVASFNAVAKTAEMMKSVGVQVNTLNDNRRNGGDDDGDRKFFERFRNKGETHLAVVEGTKMHDPEETPITPEMTIVGAEPDEEPAPEPYPESAP